MYHDPVLLQAAVDGLLIRPGGTYVDVTYGGGGHSKEILKRLQGGRLIAFDQDADVEANRIDDDRLTLLNHNFRYLKNLLQYHRLIPVDGIIADLGVSSHQFDVAARGFSFRFGAPLDMRMNQNQKLSAADILNEYSTGQLMEIFRQYGELSNSSQLANKIAAFRKQQKIITCDDLRSAISGLIEKRHEDKYLAKVFQALRIETNSELDALKEFLMQSLVVLKKSGRLVVISYHSLEDRLVKNFMKAGNFDGIIESDLFGNTDTPFELISRKAITPDEKEISQNKRARSAKLRIAEKK
ncbi:MAG TPA: 16S rRNA (cytosine(1402)-N(4))-methyltransferase RsmH [Bacteroidales bacterium]|nr:16S rRNA (cytosine(1402)-N(4))-methyltransferase RsmH [Bacteroidales bacterium]HOH83612.1 16S rRNA (cytosine(1402)-N(4))-methyltransferase RsmH [Bacteroidales bacterium]HPI30141.1 16S rRNA (cytosine(1402)-N(4))-methyltransferase RsmH [Bacteroidales bacterium]